MQGLCARLTGVYLPSVLCARLTSGIHLLSIYIYAVLQYARPLCSIDWRVHHPPIHICSVVVYMASMLHNLPPIYICSVAVFKASMID